ncbi:histidine kinase [Sphingobacterium sp. SRCM116780]|uniref:sensor histidine kinase n=1 Tax=Sphingobacterium sp. SRCM116780 TaxID=2907623 RepID=UPI001F2CF150|nr:histidine kinase [Sphingobacterium sp. SRCM116780]UIR55797.1 histidine kinase [Sphingobacterium sp. SRCM116780]
MRSFKDACINAFLITAVICTIITAVNFASNPSFNFSTFVLSEEMLSGFLIGFFLYLGNTFLYHQISKIFPQSTQYIKRILLFIPGTAVLTIIVVFIVTFSVQKFTDNLSFQNFIVKQHYDTYFNMILISIIVSLLIFSFYFYKRFKEGQLKKQKELTKTATAQFESLKNQLDPHFLFNSLNVLTSLIEEDPQKAVNFTTSLSRIYRYVLEQKDKNLIEASEEINFARIFLTLLSIRFEDALKIKIEDQNMLSQEQLVPLALQLLIENAIKHNALSPTKVLEIRIFKENDRLYIQNNLQEKESINGTGIGLKNIQERYALLTKKEVIITKTATHFTVSLPLITKEEISS